MARGISGKVFKPCEPYISLRAWREHFEDIREQLLKRIMVVHGAIIARPIPPVSFANRVRLCRNAGSRLM